MTGKMERDSMNLCMNAKTSILLQVSPKESEAVKIAADNLEADIKKVIKGVNIYRENKRESSVIIRIGTIGISENIPLSLNIEPMKDETGKLRREAYQVSVRDGELIIAGADRRGTIYGIYSFCEWMGVSPWYFWADVPVRAREELVLPEGYCVTDYPSVEYRGIFINDEEELEVWAKNYMKEATIAVRTYEKIFELLLRLKANYIWPAMHVNSFNCNRENGALAERMGIVVGTSHCDMLMRSNNKEWLPWITKKGYTDAVYDYSIEGKNREILKEYWRESVEQNKHFEVCYTLGMRGIHDSGFETEALRTMKNRSAEEQRRAKIQLLERIIHDQREILSQTLSDKPMMTFIPYKEVLALYDNGLRVPEDMTLVWANDNYGYIRRFPSEKEQKRKGGNGIYYHNSYWASPGMSYVFLCSIPLAHTRNELQKAWNEGIRKLWVLNSGAMKPLEIEITFFLRLAWEIGKEDALTQDVEAFAEDWANRTFSGGIGREVSTLLHDFSQLTNMRKPEHMDSAVFSQTAYGDEAALRVHRYEAMFEKGNRIYENLPETERAAFYQMVLLRIHAAYFTNLAYYYADRSTLMYERGNMQAAALYTGKCREYEDARRRMIVYYNTIMLHGKWNGILDPEGYPPPRAAMMPVCTPPLAVSGEPRMRVDIWNEAQELEFRDFSEKWIEIGNTGAGAVSVRVLLPKWLTISAADAGSGTEAANVSGNVLSAKIETELRICMRVTDASMPKQGKIAVQSMNEGFEKHIPVRIMPDKALIPGTATEEDGIIVLEADSAEELSGNEDFHVIRRLGRGQGNLVEAVKIIENTHRKPLVYSFCSEKDNSLLLEIHRFPSLCATGRLRIGAALDEDKIQVAESFSNDEWKGSWKENVLNNVEYLYVAFPNVRAGMHRLTLYAVDEYFAFSRLIIYTKPRKKNQSAGIHGTQRLPRVWEVQKWCDAFYGKIEIGPRAAVYAPLQPQEETLARLAESVQLTEYAKTVTPDWYLKRGARIFEEKNGALAIDAATALTESRFAWMSDKLWKHCAGESFGRSGLCLYVREEKLMWQHTEDAPALHYRFYCTGGRYTLWMLIRFKDERESCYRIGIDGAVLSEAQLYHQGSLFRYESEQIYQWVPAAFVTLAQGEHVLDVYSIAPGMRFDRFYLTTGGELPPVDTKWHYSTS